MLRYPEMSQEQESKVTELVGLMREKYTPLPAQLLALQRHIPTESDGNSSTTAHNPMRQYCYCFLVSREWSVPKAFEMMQETVEYRKTHGLDDQQVFPPAISCKGWDQQAVLKAFEAQDKARPTDQRIDRLCAATSPYFTMGYHKWDRMGQPVLYMMVGAVQEQGLLTALKKHAEVGESTDGVMWEIVMHTIAVAECLQTYQQMQYAAGALQVNAADGLIRSTTVVIDLHELTYGMLWKPAIDLFVHTVTQIFQYYPQCVHQVAVVNAPPMTAFAYRIVRGSLPDDVQKKVHIASVKDTQDTMRKLIEASALPAFYGGTCVCNGGCIHGYDALHVQESQANKAAAVAATEANTNAGEGSDFVATDEITLKAGQRHMRVFPLAQGESVVWEFVSAHEHGVTFTKYFVPDGAAQGVEWDKVHTKDVEPFIISKENPSEGSDDFVAPAGGVLVLMWDNKQSWLTAKHLQMKVFRQSLGHSREGLTNVIVAH